MGRLFLPGIALGALGIPFNLLLNIPTSAPQPHRSSMAQLISVHCIGSATNKVHTVKRLKERRDAPVEA